MNCMVSQNTNDTGIASNPNIGDTAFPQTSLSVRNQQANPCQIICHNKTFFLGGLYLFYLSRPLFRNSIHHSQLIK